MSLCGCVPPCSCMLNVQPPDLVTLTGDGDPVTGGWLLTVLETVFSMSNSGGGLQIAPGGAYGHSPNVNLVIDPASTASVSVSGAGIRVDVPPIPSSDLLPIDPVTYAADFTIDPAYRVSRVNTTGGQVGVTVPVTAGEHWYIKDVGGWGDERPIRIVPASGLIDGEADYYTISKRQAVHVVGDGTNLIVI